MPRQRIFCVSHEEPLVPEHHYDYAIGIGDYRPTKGAHISALDPFWDRMRPVAYGAAGNYAIPRAIEVAGTATDLSGVFSHRKMVIRTTIGREAVNYELYREISPEVAAQLPDEELRPRDGCDFLIGPPIVLTDGMISHYAERHHAIDLMDYLSIAVQMGVVTPADVREFALEKMFVTGGCELGIYPTNWLHGTLQKLELLGRVFLTRHAERVASYDSYQIRAIGFLAERLGSFLLLKELRRRFPAALPSKLIGCMCVVVPDGTIYDCATI